MHWRVFAFVVVMAVAGPPVAAELGAIVGDRLRAQQPADLCSGLPRIEHAGPGTASDGSLELLHFWRPNCPVSVKTQLRVRALQARGYAIRSINTLHERELSRRYQIDATPTFITLEDGVVVDRVAGGLDAEAIAELLHEQ